MTGCKSLASIPLALTLTVAAAACGKAESRTRGAAVGSEEATDSLAAKLDAYVTCINTFSRDVHAGRRAYLDSFDGKQGPTAEDVKKGRLYGPRKLSDPKECLDGVAAAEKLDPRRPKLEAAGKAYVTALQKIVPLYAELDPYFEREDYRDDALAKGKARHPELMAAWQAFGAADQSLSDEVDSAEDEVQQARLAHLEKTEGKKLRFLHTRLIATAKKVVRAGLADDPSEIDLEKLQAAVSEYETHWAELHAFAAAHKAEVDAQVMAYWRIDSPAEELLKSGKAVMRRRRDKVPFSTGERSTIAAHNAESVEGHPASLLRAYNGLIDATNGMSFRVAN